MAEDRVPTGVPALDELLGGGLETDALTEVYGEGGSGKSIFCLDLATRVALTDRWVFYIDTEGVSVERLQQTAANDLDRVLRRLLISQPKNLEEQTKAVGTACSLARDGRRPVGLVVLDSATFYYRLTLAQSDEDEAREELIGELANLVSVAREAAVPTLFTNQVWRSLENGQLEPLGGSFVNHAAKTILRFERLRGDRRRAVLVKHRSRPEGEAEFRLTPQGIE